MVVLVHRGDGGHARFAGALPGRWYEIARLSKTEQAHQELRDVFASKGDIINNQLSFSTDGVTLRGYKDAADYVKNYPFATYQFTTVIQDF